MFNIDHHTTCSHQLLNICYLHTQYTNFLVTLSKFYTFDDRACISLYSKIFHPHRWDTNLLAPQSKFYTFDDRACISLYSKIFHPHRWDTNLLAPQSMFYMFNDISCTRYRRERLHLYKLNIQSSNLQYIMYIIHDTTHRLYLLDNVPEGIICTNLRKCRNIASKNNHKSSRLCLAVNYHKKKLDLCYPNMFKMSGTFLHHLYHRECTCL